MGVRKQVDPNRSEAAKKAWATRRRENPEKYGKSKESNARRKDVSRRAPKTVAPEEPEKEQVKWHLTSRASTTVHVGYSFGSKISSFIDKPWVEKYRPVSLKDVVGDVVEYLKAFVMTGSVPLSMIFHGEYGDGKTTCAKAFVRDFYVARGLFKRTATFRDITNATNMKPKYEGMFPLALYIDADLVGSGGMSGVEVIRTRVQNFMKYWSGKWHKFVIIDEADRLGFEAQGALSSLIERYSRTRTIYTTNYLDDIMDRIVSRSAGGVFEFVKPKPVSIAAYLNKICKAERVSVSRAKLMEIAKSSPSVRDAVGMLQQECALLKVKAKSRRR